MADGLARRSADRLRTAQKNNKWRADIQARSHGNEPDSQTGGETRQLTPPSRHILLSHILAGHGAEK